MDFTADLLKRKGEAGMCLSAFLPRRQPKNKIIFTSVSSHSSLKTTDEGHLGESREKKRVLRTPPPAKRGCHKFFLWASCSTSPPGRNQVDGLPPAQQKGRDNGTCPIGPHIGPCVGPYLGPFFLGMFFCGKSILFMQKHFLRCAL